MNHANLEARIRQLLAIDKNALDIYTDLAKQSDDKAIREQLLRVAKDEKRHISLSAAILSSISKLSQ